MANLNLQENYKKCKSRKHYNNYNITKITNLDL